MIQIRKSNERGQANFGWLDSRHSFSFGEYYDPRHMGYRTLRVINEDWIDPGQGFGMHPHRDMEIFTYIVEGALEHKDSMGNGSVIRPGDIQRMSAGQGVRHSEFNPSPEETVHLLQIWIQPAENGITPGYEEGHFPVAERQNKLRLMLSPDGREGSVRIFQDALVYASLLDAEHVLTYAPGEGRGAWLQLIKGALTLNDQPLESGDAAAIEGEPLHIQARADAEFLLFDLQ